MYGTVAKYRIKPGMLDEFKNRFSDESGVDGFHSIRVFQSDQDPNEVWMVAIFDDEETYFRNANSQEQHSEYLKLREMLVSEPEWHDGHVIITQDVEQS